MRTGGTTVEEPNSAKNDGQAKAAKCSFWEPFPFISITWAKKFVIGTRTRAMRQVAALRRQMKEKLMKSFPAGGGRTSREL